MSHLREANGKEIHFKWGAKKGDSTMDKSVHYESFMHYGVEYFLYDSVYLYGEGEVEPYIGKLVRIYETATHEKKAKIVWFFRPVEVTNFLNGYEPRWNEIFLASGEGSSLMSINPLDAVVQKCNVLCASKDQRNPQASQEELRNADYIFYHTFDVGKCRIETTFPERIGGIKVERLFNRKRGQAIINSPNLKPKANAREQTRKSTLSPRLRLGKEVGAAVKDGKLGLNMSRGLKESRKVDVNVEKQGDFPRDRTPSRFKISVNKEGAGPGRSSCSQVEKKAKVRFSEDFPKTSVHKDGTGARGIFSSLVEKKAKVRFAEGIPKPSVDKDGNRPSKISYCQIESNASVKFLENGMPASSSDVPFKKRKLLLDDKPSKEVVKLATELSRDRGTKTGSLQVEVTRRPEADRRAWFKELPWEEKLQKAQEEGTLLSLENLDPSFRSSDVEDLVWNAFHEQVEAKMFHRSTFSSLYSGKALVIFKSKDAAEWALLELKSKCLMIDDNRPVVGKRATLRKPAKEFVGHLVMDKMRARKQREEMRTALSTSHCSQPNTIEYDMAMQWRVLQAKSDLCWKALHEQQEDEIQQLIGQMKHNGQK